MYFVVGCWVMAAPFNATDEVIPGLREKVVCVDFSALMIMFHLLNHGSRYIIGCCGDQELCVVRIRACHAEVTRKHGDVRGVQDRA